MEYPFEYNHLVLPVGATVAGGFDVAGFARADFGTWIFALNGDSAHMSLLFDIPARPYISEHARRTVWEIGPAIFRRCARNAHYSVPTQTNRKYNIATVLTSRPDGPPSYSNMSDGPYQNAACAPATNMGKISSSAMLKSVIILAMLASTIGIWHAG